MTLVYGYSFFSYGSLLFGHRFPSVSLSSHKSMILSHPSLLFAYKASLHIVSLFLLTPFRPFRKKSKKERRKGKKRKKTRL